jgi:putative peptidoglycan binding protein
MNISKGYKDAQINLELQKRLNIALQEVTGFEFLALDGQFGDKTEAAVKLLQTKFGLEVDGIIGEQTLQVLQTGQAPPPPKKYTAPVRGKVIKLTLEDVLHRALACVKAPVTYHLEYPNGGDNPEAIMPCDEHTGGLDCSGFNAWVHGFDRFQPKDFHFWDGYLNTDSKIAEAETDGLWFTIHENPEAGDLIVGETFRSKLPPFKRKIGHEGTVVDVSEWKTKGLAGIQVVHCSPRNYAVTKNGSAIAKTNGTIWSIYRKYRFLRFNRDHALYLKAAKG